MISSPARISGKQFEFCTALAVGQYGARKKAGEEDRIRVNQLRIAGCRCRRGKDGAGGRFEASVPRIDSR